MSKIKNIMSMWEQKAEAKPTRSVSSPAPRTPRTAEKSFSKGLTKSPEKPKTLKQHRRSSSTPPTADRPTSPSRLSIKRHSVRNLTALYDLIKHCDVAVEFPFKRKATAEEKTRGRSPTTRPKSLSMAQRWESALREKEEEEKRANEVRIQKRSESVKDVQRDEHTDRVLTKRIQKFASGNKLQDELSDASGEATTASKEWSAQFMEGTDSIVFNNQSHIFINYPIGSPKRTTMSENLAASLARTDAKVTSFHCYNSALDDSFIKALMAEIKAGRLSHLESLHIDNNFIGFDGVLALCEVLRDQSLLPHLRELSLENQKEALPTDAEEALGEAFKENTRVVKLNLTIRNIGVKRSVDKYISRNLDMQRERRQLKRMESGELKDKPKNDMQKMLCDPTRTSIEINGDRLFVALKKDEKVEFAKSLATNTSLVSLKLTNCMLKDPFAIAIGEALMSNTTLEELSLENNAISGVGLVAICEALGFNTTLTKLQLREQKGTSPVSTQGEITISDVVAQNKTILRLGLRLRNGQYQNKVDRALRMNQDAVRRSRSASRSSPTASRSNSVDSPPQPLAAVAGKPAQRPQAAIPENKPVQPKPKAEPAPEEEAGGLRHLSLNRPTIPKRRRKISVPRKMDSFKEAPPGHRSTESLSDTPEERPKVLTEAQSAV